MRIAITTVFLILLASARQAHCQSVSATKIDEFENFGCEELKARTENLYMQLIKTEGARGYIIVYEGKYRSPWSGGRYVLPHFGEGNSRVAAIRKHIRFLKISEAPIRIILGGYRERLEAEYFLIPPGCEDPKPSPTLKGIKHRKGRPVFYVNPAEC